MRHQKTGRLEERRTAKRLGGKLTPGSGATWHSKGDISAGKFLIENKATAAKSFRITTMMWDKICTAAIKVGKYPAVTVQIDVSGKKVHLVVIDEMTFDILRGNQT